jgi:hypothetical protein
MIYIITDDDGQFMAAATSRDKALALGAWLAHDWKRDTYVREVPDGLPRIARGEPIAQFDWAKTWHTPVVMHYDDDSCPFTNYFVNGQWLLYSGPYSLAVKKQVEALIANGERSGTVTDNYYGEDWTVTFSVGQVQPKPACPYPLPGED